MGNNYTCPHKIKERASHHQQLLKNFEWNADIKSDVPVKKTKLPLKAKTA